MLKYRRCLKEEDCKMKQDDPMTGAKNKACFFTGKCQYHGCQMIMPTKSGEENGSLIIDAIKGKFG